MASTAMPTTATHTRARCASKRSAGLEIRVGLARSSRGSSSSALFLAIRCLSGIAQLGAQSGPGPFRAQCVEPAQRVPARAAVEREGDDLGAAAHTRDRYGTAQTVAERR